jgi:hypothetical protein
MAIESINLRLQMQNSFTVGIRVIDYEESSAF